MAIRNKQTKQQAAQKQYIKSFGGIRYNMRFIPYLVVIICYAEDFSSILNCIFKDT